MEKLVRGLGLRQSVAVNMIDMVGIGPFITIPFIIGAMNGPQCILAWLLGALLSFADGNIWAELGAKWPEAGGSYVFLQNLFGKKKWGKLLSFLYVWQTSIQAPLVIASGAIGFAQYLNYLVEINEWQQKAVSGSLVVLLTLMLYRGITSIGKISVFMGVIVIGTILWLIGSGISRFDSSLAFTYPDGAFDFTSVFFFGLGQASIKTVYSFLGYYNVCHLGAEIKNPEKNIPRSIFISIAGIAFLYLAMQLIILGNIPWQEAKDSSFIVSTYFEKIYNKEVAQVATALILFIAVSSLFAVMLGYSRVLYSAAADGNFFSVFAKVHSVKKIPHVSLIVLGSVAFFFSLLFKMKEIITAIIVMRILVQFVGQGIGLMLYHYQKRNASFPFRMRMYPLPIIVSIVVWMFIFFTAEVPFIVGALGVIAAGVIIFLAMNFFRKNWPFAKSKSG